MMFKQAREMFRGLKRRTRELCELRRIPFYEQISRIPTHMTMEERVFLYKSARDLASGSVIAEIGSYLGASACFLASGGWNRISKLYCIDTWENDAMSEGPKKTFDAFLQNTSVFKNIIAPLKGKSMDVVELVDGPVDLLFIDGDHSYEAVTADLKTYLPKVKGGGLLILHDWGWAEGVQRAVRETIVPIQVDQPDILPNMYSVRIDPSRLSLARPEETRVAFGSRTARIRT
jgi:predicted O-methyltransferase YrrM